MKRQFVEGEIKKAGKHVKRSSNSLAIRVTQSFKIIRYYFIKLVKIIKLRIPSVGRDVGIAGPLMLLVGVWTGAATLESNQTVLSYTSLYFVTSKPHFWIYFSKKFPLKFT